MNQQLIHRLSAQRRAEREKAKFATLFSKTFYSDFTNQQIANSIRKASPRLAEICTKDLLVHLVANVYALKLITTAYSPQLPAAS